MLLLRRIGTVAVFSLCRACRRWNSSATLSIDGAQILRRTPGLGKTPLSCGLRSTALLYDTEGEKKITEILEERLSPSYVHVRDISGGCGSMYEIVIDAECFKGKRTLLQHKMVNQALGDDLVKSLHGLTIRIGNPETKT